MRDEFVLAAADDHDDAAVVAVLIIIASAPQRYWRITTPPPAATIRVIIGVLSAFHFPVKEGAPQPAQALDADATAAAAAAAAAAAVAADDPEITHISHVQANAGVEIVGINLEDAVNADEDNQVRE